VIDAAIAQALGRAIAQASGAGFKVASMEPVSGGCIHQAFAITGKGAAGEQRFFAKTNAPDQAPMFAAEADGLQALRDAKSLTVPGVVAHGSDDDLAWLVLEWLELAALDAASGAQLGAALAAQHRVGQAKFGWERDNFIGATVQVNGWSDDWLAFWRENRLLAQLRIAARQRLPSRMIDRGERLVADCEAFFRGYVPARSLLHGDLWGGNARALEDGRPVVFDPAVYVGDREADLAMTELFGGFPKDFHAAYRAAWAPHDNYRVRRDFYNLYHVLNHANLFGGGYVNQAEKSIEKLLAEIR
jgi:protein-ribulosamine 3-kinase